MMYVVLITISLVIGFFLGLFYNKKDYQKKFDENTQQLKRYILILQKIKEDHVSSKEIIDDLRTTILVKERSLQEQDKKIAALKKQANKNKQLLHDIYESLYGYRRSIRMNEKRYTSSSSNLVGTLIDTLNQLVHLRDTISLSIKEHKIKYDEVGKKEWQHFFDLEKEYRREHPDVETYISWNDSHTKLYYRSIDLLSSTYNLITFILVQIESINLISIPSDQLEYIPFEQN